VLDTENKFANAGTVADMENYYHRNWLTDLKAIIGHEDAQELGRKELLGRDAKGWQVIEGDEVCAVWADARTGELLRVEFERGSNRMVMSQFVLDRDLDESLFDMTPPEGYMQFETTVDGPAVQDIVILLRVWVSGNDGQFPDRLDAAAFPAAAAKADWRELGIDSYEKATAWRNAISEAFYLLNSWGWEWSYLGKGVNGGQKDEPVFWCRRQGSNMYTVIYADFSVAEISSEELEALNPKDSSTDRQ
jgi:hypothetical protein